METRHDKSRHVSAAIYEKAKKKRRKNKKSQAYEKIQLAINALQEIPFRNRKHDDRRKLAKYQDFAGQASSVEEEALAWHKQARQTLQFIPQNRRTTKDWRDLATYEFNIGIDLDNLDDIESKKNYKTALGLLNNIPETERKNDDIEFMAECYQKIGQVQKLNKPDKALLNFKIAIEMYSGIPVVELTLRAKENLATSYVHAGILYFEAFDYSNATDCINQALQMHLLSDSGFYNCYKTLVKMSVRDTISEKIYQIGSDIFSVLTDPLYAEMIKYKIAGLSQELLMRNSESDLQALILLLKIIFNEVEKPGFNNPVIAALLQDAEAIRQLRAQLECLEKASLPTSIAVMMEHSGYRFPLAMTLRLKMLEEEIAILKKAIAESNSSSALLPLASAGMTLFSSAPEQQAVSIEYKSTASRQSM